MIRINLLPHAPKKSQSHLGAIYQIVAGVAVLIMAVVYFMSLQTALEETLAARKKELDKLKKDIEEKKQLIQGLEPLEALRRETEQKLDVVNQVQKQKVNPVLMMELISNHIPKRVWLREMDERTAAIRLQGVAANPQDVAEFMAALEADNHFDLVKLTDIVELKIPDAVMGKLQSQPNLKFVKFDLNFKFIRDPGAVAAKKPGK